MKQADLGLSLTTKRTRKREFLAEMERLVPWVAMVDLITSYAPEGRRGQGSAAACRHGSGGQVDCRPELNQECDPQMKQSKKVNQWYFGMKAHIGVDADSDLMHTARGSVNDLVEANILLHGEKPQAWRDAGYQGVDKRTHAKDSVGRNIAMRPGKRKLLDKNKLVGRGQSAAAKPSELANPRGLEA